VQHHIGEPDGTELLVRGDNPLVVEGDDDIRLKLGDITADNVGTELLLADGEMFYAVPHYPSSVKAVVGEHFHFVAELLEAGDDVVGGNAVPGGSPSGNAGP
jgi:hypothetical protein